MNQRPKYFVRGRGQECTRVATSAIFPRAWVLVAAIGCSVACGNSSPAHPIIEGTIVVSNPAGIRLLALDANNLYWISFPNVSPPSLVNAVYETPKAGGANTQLGATSAIQSIGLDATTMYFPLNDTIVAAPFVGGPSHVVIWGTTTTAVTVANGTIYWIDDKGSALSVPVAGGAATTILPLPNDVPPEGALMIASSNDSAYASFSTGFLRLPYGDEPATWLSAPGAVGFASDETTLYWVTFPVQESGGRSNPSTTDFVTATPKAGGVAVHIAAGDTLSGSVAVDATNVYFARETGRVLKVAKAGGATTVLANYSGSPERVLTDDINVYWDDFSDGAIRKVTK